MACFRPFRAIRPKKDYAEKVASRPYDVLNSEEAKIEAAGNEFSFLRVIKPEIDCGGDLNPYSEEVYQKGKQNLESLRSSGVLFQENDPCFYVYRLTMDGRTQTGIVGCCDYEEYYEGKIKKHELTRTAKEEDRDRHVETQNANDEPVFFSYRGVDRIDALIEELIDSNFEYDFHAEDGIRHQLWVVDDADIIAEISTIFESVPALYVADGHHRTAAAARVGLDRKSSNSQHNGQEEYNFFMAVLFSDSQLKIFDYNRVVRDLNGLTTQEFVESLKGSFEVVQLENAETPCRKGIFSMYLSGTWYSLSAKNLNFSGNPVQDLDVSLLSEKILDPILGVTDLRNDQRIDFVGGIRGLCELEKRVDSGEMAVAFALFPVSMGELLDVADAGEIMPPKTTWFEPKLRSGLFIHSLE